jgi:hypothetical protein
MPEIGTSGLMSGDGKRGLRHRARPRLYFFRVVIALLNFGRAYALRFIVVFWVRDLVCVGG